MVKRIAMYGSFRTLVPEKERRWKIRRDGIRQRYWYNTGKRIEAVIDGRFEFEGTGRELYNAIVMALRGHHVPRKQFEVVSAREFLENPTKFSRPGLWVEKEVYS